MGQINIEYTQLPGLNKKGEPGLIGRPVLDFTLNYKHSRMFSTAGLLDSGADYNLFPGEWCRVLGINLTKGMPVDISGIGSRVPLKGYRHHGINFRGLKGLGILLSSLHERADTSKLLGSMYSLARIHPRWAGCSASEYKLIKSQTCYTLIYFCYLAKVRFC